ncbi:hypothetical protein [Saccharopolyspora sp. CA-218241]|uniref:hypothetical protein n=1 Tax=Saccharopolyspora sp. CA-218241 TaxID=3240027 RepID=UPI003D9652A8
MEREESIRRLRAALTDAVGRGRRARTDAHRHAEEFRQRTGELAREAPGGGGDHAAAAADYRRRAGLPVEEFPEKVAETSEATPESPEHTSSDGSDLDFSQARIMR